MGRSSSPSRAIRPDRQRLFASGALRQADRLSVVGLIRRSHVLVDLVGRLRPVGEDRLSNSDHSQTEALTELDASRRWKGPQLGLAGVLYARIPHGRWGAGGLKALGIFQFEPNRFRNLYRIAHSERRWKSGITRVPAFRQSRALTPSIAAPAAWRCWRRCAGQQV
jgi:hypothetical protein